MNFKEVYELTRIKVSREIDGIFRNQVDLYAQLLADNVYDMVEAQINEQIIWLINDKD
jgi:hypothetical protein